MIPVRLYEAESETTKATERSGGGARAVTVDDAADQLRQQLLDAGFDPARPEPVLAWEVFKRFATEPVEAETTELWFEAGDGDPAKDAPAYFDFVRMFVHYPEDGAEWGEQITAHFTGSPGVRLGLGGSVHAADVTDLSSWFRAVEALPSFKAGLAFAGWSFEVRIDGC